MLAKIKNALQGWKIFHHRKVCMSSSRSADSKHILNYGKNFAVSYARPTIWL